MTTHTERRIVPYSADQMYRMVAAIDRYPEFIPWISNARIRERKALDSAQREALLADLVVSFRVFRERYTSRVLLDPADGSGALHISVEAITGPFDILVSDYRFIPLGSSESEMIFDVKFSFKNKALQAVAGVAFDLALRKIVSAFEARAAELYAAA